MQMHASHPHIQDGVECMAVQGCTLHIARSSSSSLSCRRRQQHFNRSHQRCHLKQGLSCANAKQGYCMDLRSKSQGRPRQAKPMLRKSPHTEARPQAVSADAPGVRAAIVVVSVAVAGRAAGLLAGHLLPAPGCKAAREGPGACLSGSLTSGRRGAEAGSKRRHASMAATACM